jgi:putative ABC transport system permease protein
MLARGIGLQPGVLLFTLVVTTLAGLAFGVVPALRASRTDLNLELKEGGRDTGGRARQRLRSTLVAAEVGLSLVLLIGAGLMIQSLQRLQHVDKGFRSENVLTARVSLPAVRYDEKEKIWSFYERLLERVEVLPGVQSASLTNIVPLGGNSWERGIWPEGVPIERDNVESVLFHMVSPGHFETFRIPIVKGRAFDETDREGGLLAAIIDETMAEKFWPGEDPIGKRVTFESVDDEHAEEGEEPARIWRTVVGVAKNVRHYELENPSRVQVYVSMDQSEQSWTRGMSLAVRTEGDPTRLTESIRRELAALDPDVPLARIETMDGYVENALSGTRVVGGLLAVFSVLALMLASIGVFGVMSYSVVQRLREIGIRMALGARGGDVLKLVVRQGLLITVSGLVVGLTAAFGLTRLMTSVLYQIEPVDPLTYGAVSAILVGVSMLAAYIPARNATRVDPIVVLRDE